MLHKNLLNTLNFPLKLANKWKFYLLCLCLGIFGENLTPSLALAQNNSEPIFGRQTLNQNFNPNPLILDGVSGGNSPVNSITNIETTPTGSCKGYMQRQPDYEIILNAPFNSLTMEVRSEVDTTLVITGLGGTWCNDDYDGQPNPQINGSWAQGDYQIWVGSYQQNSYHPYQLRISR
jgi:hypothetical protein